MVWIDTNKSIPLSHKSNTLATPWLLHVLYRESVKHVSANDSSANPRSPALGTASSMPDHNFETLFGGLTVRAIFMTRPGAVTILLSEMYVSEFAHELL